MPKEIDIIVEYVVKRCLDEFDYKTEIYKIQRDYLNNIKTTGKLIYVTGNYDRNVSKVLCEILTKIGYNVSIDYSNYKLKISLNIEMIYEKIGEKVLEDLSSNCVSEELVKQTEEDYETYMKTIGLKLV